MKFTDQVKAMHLLETDPVLSDLTRLLATATWRAFARTIV